MDPVRMLQALLRVRSVNPPGDETDAAAIVAEELRAGGLEVRMLDSPEGRSSVIGRIPGPTDRPALILLSHTDVVPVEEDHWTHDPFGGEIDEGSVWGRGALDMKSITVMHVAAACALTEGDKTREREILVVAVADEEAGGEHGASWLLNDHPELLGFGEGRPPPEVIGEGGYGLEGVLESPIVPIVLGEKTAVWLRLEAEGNPGHGAIPPREQAAENLLWAVARVSGYRDVRINPVLRDQFTRLAEASRGPRAALFRALASGAGSRLLAPFRSQLGRLGALGATLADTVTLTQLEAGYKQNVVPAAAYASLDCRLLPDTDPSEFVEEMSRRISGRGVRMEMPKTYTSGPVSQPGPLFAEIDRATVAAIPDAVVVPSLTPAITDIRFFRERGATGYGWVPLVLERGLLATIHGHDEHVPVDRFETAVAATVDLVRRAAEG